MALKADASDLKARQGGLAALPGQGDGALLSLLRDDSHLAPVLGHAAGEQLVIPGKDNGFDVEGLATFEGRLLLGLRGPVLRGWAFVLDFTVAADTSTLAIAGGKHRYRKHALHLDGLGVRDLLVGGDDVLVLAGPTMALDGVHRVYRWHGGPPKGRDSLLKQEKGVLEPLFDVPFAPGADRAEGLTLSSWFEPNDSLLVLYDAPSAARQPDERSVLADVYAL